MIDDEEGQILKQSFMKFKFNIILPHQTVIE